jgi:hypothetical protein
MAPTSLQLDLLPAEIIQRIASFSPYESVFALLIVNRRLHQTCDDIVVFRAVIKNGSGYGVETSWKCDLIFQSSSKSTLARLALADSLARAPGDITDGAGRDQSDAWSLPGVSSSIELGDLYLKGPDEGDQEEEKRGNLNGGTVISCWHIERMLRYLPQLVALHHPTVLRTNIKRPIGILVAVIASHTPTINNPACLLLLSFSVTSAILSKSRGFVPDASANMTYFQAIQILSDGLDARRYRFNADFNLRVPILASAILCSDRVHQLQPPSPYRIPFPGIFENPVPFTNLGLKSHLPVMTSASFLEDAEWVGYYTHNMDFRYTLFDPPMYGIRFTSSSTGFQASGLDNVGKFTLDGTVASGGTVRMRKTYAQGFWWEWNAQMTPFGIVGTWGRSNAPHGYVWLWKREWSDE